MISERIEHGLRWVNFGRRFPPLVGHYYTPIHKLKLVMTRGRKSFTIDPELNQHWVQYLQQYRLYNQAPLSLKQMVFPDFNYPKIIERHLEKIFGTRAFTDIRKAGIWNCYLRYRDEERYNVDCYNRVAKFYGYTYREIDSVIKSKIPRDGKIIKFDRAMKNWLMTVDQLKLLSNKQPLNAADYLAFKKLLEELNGVPLNDLPDNYKEFVEKDQIKYTEMLAAMPIP